MARILEWFAIPSSSGSCFSRTLHYHLLGGLAQHGSLLPWVSQAPSPSQGCDPRIWANSGRWWRTGKPGMLRSACRRHWVTEKLATKGIQNVPRSRGDDIIISSLPITEFQKLWNQGQSCLSVFVSITTLYWASSSAFQALVIALRLQLWQTLKG